MIKNKNEFKAVTVGSLAPKSVFTYGGVNWVVLQRIGGGILCLAEKILFEKAFDESDYNNWEDSSLREHLNNTFLEELVDAGAEEAAFLPMVTDLTADDGLKDYGSCEDIISLISCQQYRQYRGIIPNVDGWWWTCTAYSTKSNGYSYRARGVNSDGTLDYGNAYYGNGGVRPLCALSSSILVSDTPDSDGAYTIVWNRPPEQPTTITVPETIFSNQTTTIGWSAATDPDGDTVSYRLERSANGGGWSQIYSGANTTYTDNVTTAMNTLQYRVKAVDSYGEASSYTASPTRSVTHNLPPAISGVDGNLGVKSDAFSYEYTITDPENNTTTVDEKLNGRIIRTYTAQLGKQEAATVSGTNWVKLAQGSHTLTITATDSKGGAVTRSMTFTKQVNKLSVMLAAPLPAESKPTRININVVAEVPAGAAFKVEVCNNANDPAPEWEDATEAATAKHAHIFTNTMKQAPEWGVNVRVTIERNSAIGDCYITGIGGNFE